MGLHRHLTALAIRPHLPRRTVRLRLTLLYGCLFLLSGAGLLAITYELVDHQLSSPLRTSAGSVPQGAGGGIVTAPAKNSVRAQQAADLHQLFIQSAIALAIMAVVSVVLGWLVAGRVLRPIRTMTTTTRRISERSLHERLSLGGPPDEFKDLGDTIDGLLARLEAAFDSQRRFVANASHELRTPIMFTQTLLQVALADPAITLDSLRAACGEVIGAGKGQAQLVDALLVLARSQRGLDHSERIDLSAICDEVLLRPDLDINRTGLHVESMIRSAPLDGDTRLIERLVNNLVDNAIRHNVIGGHVQISTAITNGKATLSVANTGPAIPDDQIDRLIQPFQSLDRRRNNELDGLGLGLSIVSAIATAHHATLTLHPNPGGGLQVIVSFPATAPTRPTAKPGKNRSNRPALPSRRSAES